MEARRLPAPTGRYRVGRVSFDWRYPNRAEIYSADPGVHRELVAWIWYPAAPTDDVTPAEYLPDKWLPAGQFLGLDAAGVVSNAAAAPAVAEEQPHYPMLVFSPSGFPPLLLTAITEELASHGYVVVGVNHTYETTVTVFGDGRVVAMNPAAVAGVLGPQTGPYEERFRQRATVCDYKAADLASVADTLGQLNAEHDGLLGGRLDFSRLGGFGHSFGGNAALQWCRDDPRCRRAAANLDGALWTEVGQTGLDRPALQVLAEHPEFAMSGSDAVSAGIATDPTAYDAEKAVTFGGWRTVHENAQPAYTVQISGASHVSFMDLPWLPLLDESPVKPMLAATAIEPRRMWRITCDVLLAFFGRHLNRAAHESVLDTALADYPELRFGPP